MGLPTVDNPDIIKEFKEDEEVETKDENPVAEQMV